MDKPGIEAIRDGVSAATGLLSGLSEAVYALGCDGLGPLFAQIDDLARQVEAARVAVLDEALTRGVVGSSVAGSPVAWVKHWGRSFHAGGAGALVTVTRAAQSARCEGLREELLAGRVPVRNAAVAVAEMDRLRHRLTEQAVPTVWAAYLGLAAESDPAHLRRLRPELVARYGRPGEFQGEQDKLRAGVSLSQPLPDGGMFDYHLRLDPEGQAVLEAALGPLSAPRPVEGAADLRGSDQRRGDALVEICRRAAAAGGQAPTTAKTQLFLTMSLADLVDQAGAAATVGAAGAGTLLAPGTVRRLACDASLVPVVLGARSEVLDLGRERRLFTPGQTKALWLRDGACTFPSCTVPASWCDAHHLRHWCDGGPTDLSNAALLCGRHHTVVHQRDLAGTLTPAGVTWDLDRGSYLSFLTTTGSPSPSASASASPSASASASASPSPSRP